MDAVYRALASDELREEYDACTPEEKRMFDDALCERLRLLKSPLRQFNRYIEEYGDELIANLDLNSVVFEGLRKGVYVQRDDEYQLVKVNTISELCDMLLNTSGNIYRSSERVGYFQRGSLIEKLITWAAKNQKPPNQLVST